TMKSNYGSKPEDILLGIGPGIQRCHYTIQDDILHNFNGYEKFLEKKEQHYVVDLAGIVAEQAKREKIKEAEIDNQCTFCLKDKYFSYRRDRVFPPEVMLAYIGRSASVML
ncbi:polyphenol oxidase family protein, partial [Candidatus Jorgensenbacteria bacterium]|nr:polyphenol oxidase family protein [Candidatus Jorgensenbacteria bacterium]